MPTRQHGRPNILSGAVSSSPQILGGRLAKGGGGGAGGGGGGGGSGVCTIGESGAQRGYFENTSGVPLFGSITNDFPDPPGGGASIRAITQANFSGTNLGWQVRLTPNGLGQAAWTSLILSGLNGGITLLSVNATYTDNSFGASFWSFGDTVDVWAGLSGGSEQTYEFTL